MKKFTLKELEEVVHKRGIRIDESDGEGGFYIMGDLPYTPELGMKLVRTSDTRVIGTIVTVEQIRGNDIYGSEISRGYSNTCKFIPLEWLIPKANNKPDWL